MWAELPAIGELAGLHWQLGGEELPVPPFGKLVADVEIAVFPQRQGRQQVLGLVDGGVAAVGRPHADAEQSRADCNDGGTRHGDPELGHATWSRLTTTAITGPLSVPGSEVSLSKRKRG